MDVRELDDQYLNWLYARIGSVNQTRGLRTYWSLFSFLQSKEFVWIVANDDNRVEDGRYVRYEFLDESGLQNIDADWMGRGCSTLELIFGVANRLAFETDSTPSHWFWELLNNLGLSGFNDRSFDERVVEDIVDTLMWRNYNRDGTGGLFPMQRPREDQRKVEIWYQLNLYIQDRHH